MRCYWSQDIVLCIYWSQLCFLDLNIRWCNIFVRKQSVSKSKSQESSFILDLLLEYSGTKTRNIGYSSKSQNFSNLTLNQKRSSLSIVINGQWRWFPFVVSLEIASATPSLTHLHRNIFFNIVTHKVPENKYWNVIILHSIEIQ